MTGAHGSVRTVSCPNCGGTLEVRAAGFSVNLGCSYCGSMLDVSRPEVQILTRHQHFTATFPLPLGRRGSLFGDEWDVVGAMKRKDRTSRWNEYLLFNPYVGYRWLVEWNGEWQFGTMLLDRPESDADGVVWRRQRFMLDDEGQQTVTGTVVGEFYWRVVDGDTARCASYTRGDVVLSREDSEGEVNWTQLVPLGDGEVEAAFGIEPPPKRGKRRSQRMVAQADAVEVDDLPRMFLVALVVAVAALLAMIVIAGPVDHVSDTAAAPLGATREGQKIGTITIRRPWQFVTVTASASDFDNRWVDLDYSLVDRATGQSIDGYGLVEHYSGTDSDGAWSEGSRRSRTLLGQVPRGVYDVYVDAAAHSWPVDTSLNGAGGWATADTVNVGVEVRTGSLPWGNWWTLVALLFLFPCLIAWHRFRERSR